MARFLYTVQPIFGIIENQNQSPVRDRQSKKRNYSGKTTCIPATEYSGSPAPPTKNNSSRVKEKIPKFDVANENDFNDFENSNSLFDEVGFQIPCSDWSNSNHQQPFENHSKSSKFEEPEISVKNEPESSLAESIRRTNPSLRGSLFGKEKKSYKIRKFGKPIVARKAFKSNNNTEYDHFR